MKKQIIIASCIMAGICLLVGGILVFRKTTLDNNVVDVVPAQNYIWQRWDEDTYTSGIVTTDVTQDIYLATGQVVQEIFVQEGDEVKVGDELLSYDMTLVSIELEMELLNEEMLGLRKALSEKELEKLRKEKPIQTSALEGDKSGRTRLLVASETQPEDTEEPPQETPQETEPDTEPPVVPPVSEKLETLDYNTKPSEGSGTAEKPYIFNCVDGVVVKGEFFNRMKGYDKNGTSELHSGGYYFVIQLWDIAEEEEFLMLVCKYKPGLLRIYDPEEELVLLSEVLLGLGDMDGGDDDMDYMGDFVDMGDFDGDMGIVDGYTKEELAKMILEKEKEIKKYELDIKQSLLKSGKIKKSLEDQTIKSTVNGTVKKVGDPEVGMEQDGSAFLTVTSTEGFYVKGTISEMLLGDISIGSMIQGMAYDSGSSFTAEIQEISEYPDNTGYSYGGGNSNVSYYPFIAYIDSPVELKNYEYVELTISMEQDPENMDAVYLYEAYVREEDGKSYIYIVDENERLKKQEVITGKKFYESIEIKSGLKRDDRIAFPYGKNVKEGSKVKDSNEDIFM